MSDTDKQQEQAVEETNANPHFWSDETVDALAGLAIITLMVVMALFYVIG